MKKGRNYSWRSIKILGKVTLKQVVDDEYKQKASKELQNAIAKVDEELANFDKNMNKTITELTLKAHPQVEQVRRQFNAEREKIAVYKECSRLRRSKQFWI